MSVAREKMLESLQRAKAVAAFEDAKYDKALETPIWIDDKENPENSRWETPKERQDAFSERIDRLREFGRAPVKHTEPIPAEFEESIAEFDESGKKCSVRPLPDCEHIDPSELYDFRESERFKYARAARNTFNAITETETGHVGNPERLQAQWSETEVLKSQSHVIAARIERASRREADFHNDESLFVPMYRETNYGVYSYYLFSKVRTQAPKFRNSCFLPYMASQTRGKMLKALESYLENNPFARMWTFTSGQRVGLSEIRKRTQKLHRRLSKLNKFLRDELGIEMVFRATEFGTPETGKKTDGQFERSESGEVKFHVHSHCLVRIIDDKPMSKQRWQACLERVWEFWGHHWDDGKSVKDVRELCKYVSKPAAILGLEDWELLTLYRETNSLHLIQPMGELREQIRSRKDRKMRLEKVNTPDGPVFQEVHDWNCNREAEKDEFEKAFLSDEEKLNKLEKKIRGTEDHEEPEIRILAKCVPGYAPGSLVKEPRIVVMATNWNQGAIEKHPLVRQLIAATWEKWQAGQELAAAIRVHTGTTTVSKPQTEFSWFDDEGPVFEEPPIPENVDFSTECLPV